MRNLKEVYFGCVDAGTEAERQPSIFRKVFYDPHNYLDEIIKGPRFIVRGRKGDGKTAYGAMLGLLDESTNIRSITRSLNDFNSIIFEKIKTYDRLGGNPYISFCKCIIMIECIKMISCNQPNIQLDEYVNMQSSLHKCGLLEKDNDISFTISRLVESNTTINMNNFFGHGRRREYEVSLYGTEQIYSAIYKAIKSIFVNDQFILIIDGLDDILKNQEFKPDIITGLIRASEEINRKFSKETLSLKIIVLIRDDVLNICRDPNLSKITRDSEMRLSWRISDSPYDSELINLVNRRFTTA